MYALTNAKIFTGKEELSDRTLLIEGDCIHSIIPSAEIPPHCVVYDLQGCQIAPGFIDLQLNGCGGVMFNDAITPETLEVMHKTNLKSGTTSFLPTLITTSDEEMLEAIATVKTYRQKFPDTIVGLHLEGPYFNLNRKGIHNADYIRSSDTTMIEAIASQAETVRIVTLAPEIVNSSDIHTLSKAGIIVSAGHSDATFEQALAGFQAGVKMVTHLFNAMSPWLGRNPGLVGATFSQPEIYAGIIADGYHVHFSSIQLAQQLKQDKLILVTDATAPVGTQMKSFQIGGQQVFYQEGKCVSADGTLGGSALTMIEAVANCARHLPVSLAEILRMASTYPAQLIGVSNRLGYIIPGYVANLVIFNDRFEVIATLDRGNPIPALNQR